MRRFASDLLTSRNIAFRFQAPDRNGEIRLNADIRREVFLTFKEGLHNIVRHSRCTEAAIALRLEAGGLELILSDNGVGFNRHSTSGGHGLANLQARARAILAARSLSPLNPIGGRWWFSDCHCSIGGGSSPTCTGSDTTVGIGHTPSVAGLAGGVHSVIDVAIIEDTREIREGLAALIGGSSGFSCARQYGCMEDAIDLLAAPLPDVVLVDLALPGISGIDGIHILKDRYPTLVLVVLSVYDDDERIFDALCAGASGYLLKKTPPVRLLEALTEAADGGSPMSPQVARRVIRLFRDLRAPKTPDHDLTGHEVRLLRLLVEGHNYKTAAAELKVSVNTVAFHMRNVYQKLHVHSKSEAVSRALRDHIVE